MTHIIFEDGTDQGQALWLLVGADRRATARVQDGRIVRGYLSHVTRRGLTLAVCPTESAPVTLRP